MYDILKIARAKFDPKPDTYIDASAYMSIAEECKERKNEVKIDLEKECLTPFGVATVQDRYLDKETSATCIARAAKYISTYRYYRLGYGTKNL